MQPRKQRLFDTLKYVANQLLFSHEVPGSVLTSEGYALSWQGTAVMGILNVTPDSFSDGGKHYELDAAKQAALAMLKAGAFVLDVGGESTRPGAEPVSVTTELERVLPLINYLATETTALISIDTSKPEVAQAAFQSGAHVLNDVTGLQNHELVTVCAKGGVPAVIMHMQGEPRTMQQNPSYDDLMLEIKTFLVGQAENALANGVPSVMIDPGFGFGKTLEHNLTLVRELAHFTETGYPVLVGGSRKSSLAKLAETPEGESRDPSSVALHLYAAQRGAAMVRVHNVYAHVQALRTWRALNA